MLSFQHIYDIEQVSTHIDFQIKIPKCPILLKKLKNVISNSFAIKNTWNWIFIHPSVFVSTFGSPYYRLSFIHLTKKIYLSINGSLVFFVQHERVSGFLEKFNYLNPKYLNSISIHNQWVHELSLILSNFQETKCKVFGLGYIIHTMYISII